MNAFNKVKRYSNFKRFYSSKPFAGKTSLVTGSTSGIGFKVAEMLASNGCNVLINGFVPNEEGEQAAKALREKTGAQVVFHPANLTIPEQCRSLVDQTNKVFGRGPDILVNNGKQKRNIFLTEYYLKISK